MRPMAYCYTSGIAGMMDLTLWMVLSGLLLILLALKHAAALQKKTDTMRQESLKNQQEMLGLLKEIRDSVKK